MMALIIVLSLTQAFVRAIPVIASASNATTSDPNTHTWTDPGSSGLTISFTTVQTYGSCTSTGDRIFTTGIPDNWTLSGNIDLSYIKSDGSKVPFNNIPVNQTGNLDLTISYPPAWTWLINTSASIREIHIDLAIEVRDQNNLIVPWVGGDQVNAPGTLGPGQNWDLYCNNTNPKPELSIVKYTNGIDAKDPNGIDVPSIPSGDPVTWTYRVTNTGDWPIAKAFISVTDNQTGVTPVFDKEIIGNGDDILVKDEVWQYIATGTAIDLVSPPQDVIVTTGVCTYNGTKPPSTAYTNIGTVTVPEVTASDSSNYCNPSIHPGIDIIKYTNDQVASNPNGTDVPILHPGDPVTWTYKVTNTGNVPFPKADVLVTDNQPGVTPAFDSEVPGTGNGDNTFDPGEVWLYKATGIAIDTTLAPQGENIVHNACSLNNNLPYSPAYVNTGTVTVPGDTASANSSYCNPLHYPYFGENGYIGVEDWINGDYDYNDFGFYFRIEETNIWECPTPSTCGPYLSEIKVTTTAKIYDSGMDHLIHLHRIFTGGVHFSVMRTIPADPNDLVLFDGATGHETPAGDYVSATGNIDVTLYNTAKYSYPQKQMDEPVVVDFKIDDPSLNPRITGTYIRSYTVGPTTFHDLDPIMSQYDFWEEGTQFTSRWHLKDTHAIDSTTSQKNTPLSRIIPAGTVLPFMIVVPTTDWIPPYEATTITGPYGFFRDFYTTSDPADWFDPTVVGRVTNNCVIPGGVSFGPYPGIPSSCSMMYIPLVSR